MTNFNDVNDICNVIIEISPTEGGSASGAGTYEQGSLVMLSAYHNEGYLFESWCTQEGSIVSSEPEYSFTAPYESEYTLIAKFKQTPHCDVSVIISPVEGGSVTGTGRYEWGQSVTLYASENFCYRFNGWYLNEQLQSSDRSYSFPAPEQSEYILTAKFDSTLHSVNLYYSEGGMASFAPGYENPFNEGAEVVVIAMITSPDYSFDGWYNQRTAEKLSDELEYRFIMGQEDIDLYANFVQSTFIINTTVTPIGGGSVTGAGEYVVGEQVTLTATATVSSEANYVFDHWEDGSEIITSNPYIFTADSSKTVTAVFKQIFYITTEVLPENSGKITVSPNNNYYFYGDIVSFIVSTSRGYKFSLLNIETEGSTTPYSDTNVSITIRDNVKASANFTQLQQFTVTAIAESDNSEADPVATITGNGQYYDGEVVTLNYRNSKVGYVFTGWYRGSTLLYSDNGYSFIVTEDVTDIVARFEYTTYEVTCSVDPEGYGTVTGAGTYDYKDTATLTATPIDGRYIFSHWSNGVKNNIINVTVTSDLEFTAYFKTAPKKYNVIVNALPPAGGSVSGGGVYEEAKYATVYASPNEGYSFDGWRNENTGVIVSTERRYKFVVRNDVTLSAIFTNYFITPVPVARDVTKHQFFMSPGSDRLAIYKEPIFDDYNQSEIVGYLYPAESCEVGATCFYNVIEVPETTKSIAISENNLTVNYKYSSPCFINDVKVSFKTIYDSVLKEKIVEPVIQNYESAPYYTSVQPHYSTKSSNQKIVWLCIYNQNGVKGWIKYTDDQLKAPSYNKAQTALNYYIFLSKIEGTFTNNSVETNDGWKVIHSGSIDGPSGPVVWNKLLSPISSKITLNENTPCIIRPRNINSNIEQQRWYTTRGYLASAGFTSDPIYVYNNYLALSDTGIWEGTVNEDTSGGITYAYYRQEELYKAKFNAYLQAGDYTIHSYCTGLMKDENEYRTGVWLALRYNFAVNIPDTNGYSSGTIWNPYTHTETFKGGVPTGKWLDKRSNEQYNISLYGDYEHCDTGAVLTSSGNSFTLQNSTPSHNALFNKDSDYNLVYIFIDTKGTASGSEWDGTDNVQYVLNNKIRAGARSGSKYHLLDLGTNSYKVYSSLYNVDRGSSYSTVNAGNTKVLLSPLFNDVQNATLLISTNANNEWSTSLNKTPPNSLDYTLIDSALYDTLGYEKRWRTDQNVATNAADFSNSISYFEDDNNYSNCSNPTFSEMKKVWAVVGSKVNKSENEDYRKHCIAGFWENDSYDDNYITITTNYLPLTTANIYEYDCITWSNFYLLDTYTSGEQNHSCKELWNYAMTTSVDNHYSTYNDNINNLLPLVYKLRSTAANNNKINVYTQNKGSLIDSCNMMYIDALYRKEGSSYSTNDLYIHLNTDGLDRTKQSCQWLPSKYISNITNQTFKSCVGAHYQTWSDGLSSQSTGVMTTQLYVEAAHIAEDKDAYITFVSKPNNKYKTGDYGTITVVSSRSSDGISYLSDIDAPNGWYFNNEIVYLTATPLTIDRGGTCKFVGWTMNGSIAYYITEVYTVNSLYGEIQEIAGNFKFISDITVEDDNVNSDYTVDIPPNRGSNSKSNKNDHDPTTDDSGAEGISMSYNNSYKYWNVETEAGGYEIVVKLNDTEENKDKAIASIQIELTHNDGTTTTITTEGDRYLIDEATLSDIDNIKIKNVIKYSVETYPRGNDFNVYGEKTGIQEEYITNNVVIEMGILRDEYGNIIDGYSFSRDYNYKYYIKYFRTGGNYIIDDDIWPLVYSYDPGESTSVIQKLRLEDIISKYMNEYNPYERYLDCAIGIRAINKFKPSDTTVHERAFRIWIKGTEDHSGHTSKVFKPNINVTGTGLAATYLFNNRAIAGFSKIDGNYTANLIVTNSQTDTNYMPVDCSKVTYSPDRLSSLEFKDGSDLTQTSSYTWAGSVGGSILPNMSDKDMPNGNYVDFTANVKVSDATNKYDAYNELTKNWSYDQAVLPLVNGITTPLRVYGWHLPCIEFIESYRCNMAGQVMSMSTQNKCALIKFKLDYSYIDGLNIINFYNLDLKVMFDGVNWVDHISGPDSEGVYSIIIGNETDHQMDVYTVYDIEFFIRDSILNTYKNGAYNIIRYRLNSLLPLSLRQDTILSNIGSGFGTSARENDKSFIALNVVFNNDVDIKYRALDSEGLEPKQAYELVSRGGDRSVVADPINISTKEWINSFRLLNSSSYNRLSPEEKSKLSHTLYMTTDVPVINDQEEI